jgi:hypothetical protein
MIYIITIDGINGNNKVKKVVEYLLTKTTVYDIFHKYYPIQTIVCTINV